MPLSERTRVEVYIPDLPAPEYTDLLERLDSEFTYTFGGCTILRGVEGRYLSGRGQRIPDKVNVIYTDISLSEDADLIARYGKALRRTVNDALEKEEAAMIAVFQVFHPH